MNSSRSCRWNAVAVLAFLVLGMPVRADEPGKLAALRIETGRTAEGGFVLTGPDAVQQLLVTGWESSGRQRDLTREVRYSCTPAGLVVIDPTGVVTPLREGKGEIAVATANGVQARVGVTVACLTDEPPVGFANAVVPTLTKLGCNTGGCHGKASGQNGFKLSLFGFEPGDDYEYLVRESRGRRLLLSGAEGSLLLRKATGQLAHGGGKRLENGSPLHALLSRWVRQGAPKDAPNAPTVSRIEVLPRERVLERNGSQQILVMAHLGDGSLLDVTRLTQFEANPAPLAVVSPSGLVTTREVPGSVAVMARFQAHVAVARLVIPLGVPVADLPPEKNFIDELVFKQLMELGLPPSALCDDGTFLRRATIDVAGRLPTRDETLQFLQDKDSKKYDRLIDRLLAGGDHADYFANKWSAILRNRRPSDREDSKPTAAFHAWIRDSLEKNRPYDQFVREILTAEGVLGASPPLVWYREVKEPTAQLEDVAQLFLGQRIQCAKCHHHPLERWSQHDYYALAAFFTRLEVREPTAAKKGTKNEPDTPGQPFRVSFKPGKAEALNPRTNRPVKPAGLGGPELDVPAEVDPRQKLVDWMTARDNPYFARALVNRYWKHFFGRGLVDPEDDLRVTNPPSNAALLDALAQDFVAHGYDLKHLVRTLCTSQVYRLSAEPNAANARDAQNFSRFQPRRLQAEVLLDAIDTVTGSKTAFKGVPATTRAVQLPDNQFESYFLSVFGRPDSASACECERNGDASLAQALHLFNSEELLEKISGRKIGGDSPPADPKGKKPQAKPATNPSGPVGGRIRELLTDRRSDAEKVRDLYLLALSREPAKGELDRILAHLQKQGNPQAAYEDVLWALLNTKEFLFNH